MKLRFLTLAAKPLLRFLGGSAATIAAMGAPAYAITIGGISVTSEVSDGGLGSGDTTLFEYSYAIENGFIARNAPRVEEFRLPFFDPFSESIAFGLSAPTFWLSAFETRDSGNWQYDPALDPAADSYGAPANAFASPEFVLRFFVDPDAVQNAKVVLQSAEARLAAAQSEVAARQAARDAAAAALNEQAANVDAARLVALSAQQNVNQASQAVQAQAAVLAEAQRAVDIACIIPTNLGCAAAIVVRDIERGQLRDREGDLQAAEAQLLVANTQLSIQESFLAQRQATFDDAAQRLRTAQDELAAAQAAVADAEASLAAAPDAAVGPGESLTGFGFRSGFGPVDVPFLVLTDQGDLIIDPLAPRTANFPDAPGTTSSVFEPPAVAVFAVGLAMFGLLRRRDRTSSPCGLPARQ